MVYTNTISKAHAEVPAACPADSQSFTTTFIDIYINTIIRNTLQTYTLQTYTLQE